MVVQAQWLNDSPLKQLPHLTAEILELLKRKNVEDIADFMNMDDEERKDVLKTRSEAQVAEIVRACNRYPSIILEKSVRNKEIIAGENVVVDAVIVREGEESNEFKELVYAPYFPKVFLDKNECFSLIL